MKFALAITALFVFTSFPVLAEADHVDMKHHAAMAKMSEGTVKKVDKSSGKISIATAHLKTSACRP